MTTVEWRQLRDLFERALDRDPASVHVWLQAQPADPAIRAEVESLLDHHSRAGSFLAEPVPALPLAPTDDRDAIAAGCRIGPYTVVRELGRGGMGRVYLANDERLDRAVALKAIAPELTADAAYRDRLRIEARAAAALTHSGICTVYALEEFDGELFISSEFVDGMTLRVAVDDQPPPAPATIARTAADLAAALAHAHGRGVTHRDLKPENVMRTADGSIKILDFGLAVLDTPTSTLPRVTHPGALIGTPAYMSPEQLRGERADATSDVFAFGVLMYEYACGAHPFADATPLATAGRILEAEPRPLAERRPDLPPALAAAISRCLRKTKAERFVSAAEIVRALDDPEPVLERPRVRRWWRAHQFAVIALYFAACGAAWQVKEWRPGLATAMFVAIGIVATVGGVFRGHLLFTERWNQPALGAEQRRALPVTIAVDLFIAVALAASGALLAVDRPLSGLLTMALGIGLALARLVVEPATTAAFLKR